MQHCWKCILRTIYIEDKWSREEEEYYSSGIKIEKKEECGAELKHCRIVYTLEKILKDMCGSYSKYKIE